MTQRLTCPQGHQWDVADDDLAQRLPSAMTCPVCAAPHMTIVADGPLSVGVAQFELATLRVDPDSDPETVLSSDDLPAADRVLVPGYDILGVLGRGGMGVVYKARHLALNRVVALKMILAGSHADAEHLLRFRTEAQAVARLHHPGIVQIHDVAEHGGLPYFSLEFVDGESLDKRLGGAPLPPTAAAQLLESIARAMDCAHQQGVVHRDLKPSNVLLAQASSPDGAVFLRDSQRGANLKTQPESTGKTSRSELGSHWVPKITDFGLAKQLDVDSGHTRSGSIVGTPSYMAPEQATGRVREIGPLSDIWALGAMLYETLTGRPPFRGASVLETLEMVRSQEPVPPHRLQPRVPRDLETICLKCLQKDQRRRYASAGELAADLHRFLTGEPIRARPASVWERAVKWARKRPAVTALIGFAHVALLALLVSWGLFTVQLHAERDRADQQRLAAEASERIARRLLYAAHINLATRAWQEVQVPRMLELLGEYRQPQGEDLRGLEWYYLWRLGHVELAVRRGHAGAVSSVAFSPAGQRLVTGGADRTARVWDASLSPGTPAEALQTITGSDGEVRCVAWSPDGLHLATGTWGTPLTKPDHEITLWAAATGKKLFVMRGHQGGIAALCFSPDGRLLASAGADRTVRVWDLELRRERFILRGHVQTPQGLAFGPAGDRLASAALDKTVRLWDVVAGKELRVLGESDVAMRCVAWSSDGKRVAAGGGSQLQPFGEVRVWDAETFAPVVTLRGHTGLVTGVAFSPVSRVLATASHDGTARLWDTGGGRQLQTFRGHSSPVTGVAFRADGQVLATSGSDGTVRLWDAAVNREETLLGPAGHEGTVSSVAFSANAARLAVAASGNSITLWNYEGGIRPRPEGTLEGHTDKVVCVAFAPPGRGTLLASGGDDHTIKLWDAASRVELRTLNGHAGSVRGLAFSGDGTLLASAGTDGVVKVWRVDDGREFRTIGGHNGAVNAVAFSPDSRHVVSAGADQTLRVWNVETGDLLWSCSKSPGGFTGVAYSPDGRSVAASHKSGKVWLLAADTGAELLEFHGHVAAANAVAFSPDGQRLATASDDQTVRLWDAVTGQEMLTLTLGPSGAESWANAVAFSPDGKRLAAGSSDRKVRLWEGGAAVP